MHAQPVSRHARETHLRESDSPEPDFPEPTFPQPTFREPNSPEPTFPVPTFPERNFSERNFSERNFGESSSRGGFAPRPGPRSLAGPAHPTAPCPVCRCTRVLFDEVRTAGGLGLAECPRCEHRWTLRGPAAASPPAPARVAFVSASRLDRAAQA